jgi:hypothetical protein
MSRAALAGALLLAVLPLSAAAQTAADETQPPTTSQGPMIVERLHSGVVFAPEAKATEFDKKLSGLVGGSIGWVAEETFFIGGGGFWMPEGRHADRELAYGGLVLQWFGHTSDRFGWSAKALLGGGEATLPVTVTEIVRPPLPRPLDRNGPLQPLPQPQTITTTIRDRAGFLAAEPEVNARIAFTRSVRLVLGAGYRFAGTDWRRYGIDRDDRRRISGATGTVSVQIGG